MSARYAKRGHAPSPTADELYRQHFGEARGRDQADLTVLSEAATDEWAEALRGLALAVGGFAAVVMCWLALLPVVLVAVQRWAEGR